MTIAEVKSSKVTSEGGVKVLEVKVDPGGGCLLTVQHFASPGDDSVPLPGDSAVLVDAPGAGNKAAVGYVDPANESQANPGERRLYSRNVLGITKATLWLRGDGSVVLSNDDGSLELKSSGEVEINGVAIGTDGSIQAPGAISSSGEVTAMAGSAPVGTSTHLHPTGIGPTGSPTPGS